MKFVISALTSVALLGVAAPALAQSDTQSSKDGLYGDLGWSGTQAQGAMTQGITGRVGGRYHTYFGVEGEVTGGIASDNRTLGAGTAAQTSVDVKQKLAGAVYGVGFLPVTSNFDILARVGYGASRYGVTPGNGVAKYDVNENGIRYGVGAQYLFNGANGLRVDYTRQHMGSGTDSGGYFSADKDAGVWSVSLAHKF